jgi:peptidyl-prolyl cis-trans isomerase SurA
MTKLSLLSACRSACCAGVCALWLGVGWPPSAGAQGVPSGPATVREADRILVLVNSEPITLADLRARLARIEANPGADLPPPEVLARQVLERLIVERTQLQWAQEIGLRIDEATLNEAEANVARQNGLSVAALHERLRALGLTPSAFRGNLRDELLLQRVREREVEARVRVTERDIDAYLRDNAPLASPANTVLHLAQVLIAVPENADAATVAGLEAQAREVAQQARSGADFAALARARSAGAERETGGQMGARPADRYPALFLEAIEGLKVGDVAGPVRSGAGFHVLKVLEKRNANLPDEWVPQTRARHILVRPSPEADEQRVAQQLLALREQIVSGQIRFEEAAARFSQDGSAPQGGDLGWANPGQFVPEFEQAMNALALGEVSGPVLSRFGVHLIEVVERRSTETTPRQRREWVRNVLREQKAEDAYEEWARDLRARAFVESRESVR